MTASDKNKSHHHHHHHHHNNNNEKRKESWDVQACKKSSSNSNNTKPTRRQSASGRSASESVLSTDSDIRFTRRKLGDSQKCGCAVIAGFLMLLLLASGAVFIGQTYFRTDTMPDKLFRARFTVIEGDKWTPELTNQDSLRFLHKIRDYRERINLVIRRSDLRSGYEGCEILALDGFEDKPNLTIHFILRFDPYRGPVSTADLHSIFMEEITAMDRRQFNNITIDPDTLGFKELLGGMEDLPGAVNIALEKQADIPSEPISTPPPPRKCQPLRLNFCQSIGYNITTYPNFFGHANDQEVELDLIAFREMVDSECFRQAFDFICKLLQPPCEMKDELEVTPGVVCREYCQVFWSSCGDRIPEKFKKYLDCERYPESTGIKSCHSRPDCIVQLESNAMTSKICDGIPDCPELEDEIVCSYCTAASMHCGRGRKCVPKEARCDGKSDCPDGSDEKDCLSIAPLTTLLAEPQEIVPHRPKFYDEGYAVFSEKGVTGKLCAEGMVTDRDKTIRHTVAESLCKALGYEQVKSVEIRQDEERNMSYVRVLDPRDAEISFVRTPCHEKKVMYIKCNELECGYQSVSSSSAVPQSLPKMATPGDWPWHVALFRDEKHVCDGTLVSPNWVLTTDACFQGQPKATWLAIFGSVRLSSNSPWKQRRRIVGMIKSPVEGSTAALVRLQTTVDYSDFIRPVCLPDQTNIDEYAADNAAQSTADDKQSPLPEASRLELSESTKKNLNINENSELFIKPNTRYAKGMFNLPEQLEYSAEFTDEQEKSPKAEALNQQRMSLDYPLPENSPQTMHYKQKKALEESLAAYTAPSPLTVNYALTDSIIKAKHEWTQCNTLGWSRQRDHLQRVQLKIGDMATCENVSIATVNSMCAEAAYHKQDCNEEEFAGSPVLCLLPDNRRWALVGVASWRIACPINGVERPRMYDKITSNSAWIRSTIKAT